MEEFHTAYQVLIPYFETKRVNFVAYFSDFTLHFVHPLAEFAILRTIGRADSMEQFIIVYFFEEVRVYSEEFVYRVFYCWELLGLLLEKVARV